MPQTTESTDAHDSRILKACETANREEKPNTSKIARDDGVSRSTLSGRVKKRATAKCELKPVNKALNDIQEEVLVRLITQLNTWGMPPTAKLVEKWANHMLGGIRSIGLNWVHLFIESLPEGLEISHTKKTVKQQRIEAKDPAKLGHWYDLLDVVLRDVPSRLIYNFDECVFRTGERKNQKYIVSVNSPAPVRAATEPGENITAVECVAADGWVMDPFFVFDGSREIFERRFIESLDPRPMIAISRNGRITDELTVNWLNMFIKITGTPDRLNEGEQRVLIFNGNDTRLTLEFLQKCEEHKIHLFPVIPHSTLCQPLDDKPLLPAYKQQFRDRNDVISYYADEPMSKPEFLEEIQPIRQKVFDPSIIRESFKNRGIYPVDSGKVLSKLT